MSSVPSVLRMEDVSVMGFVAALSLTDLLSAVGPDVLVICKAKEYEQRVCPQAVN